MLISQASVKETMKRAQRCAEQNTTVRDVRDACGKVSFIFTLKEESMRPYVRRNQEWKIDPTWILTTTLNSFRSLTLLYHVPWKMSSGCFVAFNVSEPSNTLKKPFKTNQA